MIEKSEQIMREVGKVVVGKDEVIEKVLMTIYAGGHILLEDYPGVGKTTLALGFARALGLEYKRLQFTSDTMPSDVTGFSVYNRDTGKFDYKPGAVDCQMFLGDEINRTSPKTQAALLEVMEERCVTVDGIAHQMKAPFVCIATQNPVGSAGTQPLPESQLDRFMVRLSIGYPSTEHQIEMIRQRQHQNPFDTMRTVVSAEDILEIRNDVAAVKMTDEIIAYAAMLCEETRDASLVELGVSPRGVIALTQLARARAVFKDRTYVIPEDIQACFRDVCGHRVILAPQAKIEGMTVERFLQQILKNVEPPRMRMKKHN